MKVNPKRTHNPTKECIFENCGPIYIFNDDNIG